MLGPVLAFVIGWMVFDVPNADEAAITQVATFTFAGGEDLAVVRPENVNRVKVTLDKVPEHVRQAVLAAEDSTFYTNPGFDLSGIGRAIYNQLTGGVGGGSTITQQYVKVATDERDPTLWRKYKEVVLAVKISKELQKDQILENYLNFIYFGRGAYGIQAASKAYFDKNVEDLTVSEGAMLAGIIQAPSSWDPAKNPAESQRRWTFVLDQMVDKKWLDAGVRAQQAFPDNWLKEPPKLGGVPDDDRYHIYNRARVELEAQGITEDQLNTEGLVVTTTVDAAEQRKAVQAIKKYKASQPDNLRYALVSVDPKTGAILAYYGGSNGLGTDYAQALRQPGSSFKPFVLAAALQGGTDPERQRRRAGLDLRRRVRAVGSPGRHRQQLRGLRLHELRRQDGDDQVDQHRLLPDGHGRRPVPGDRRRAPGRHPRRPAAGAAGRHRAGRPGGAPDRHGVGLRHVRRRRQAAPAVHRGQGDHRRRPGADRPHRTTPTARPRQAMSQQVARNVTESLLGVAGSSNIELADGRTVAVKTGTVQLPGTRDQNKDAWTVGYTPSISTAVWVGSDASDSIRDAGGRPIFGRMVPGSIWKEYMSSALRGTPTEAFSTFVPLGTPPSANDSDDDEDSDSSDEDKDKDKDDEDKSTTTRRTRRTSPTTTRTTTCAASDASPG